MKKSYIIININVTYTQGFIVTGVAYYLQSWVIEKRGPVFLSMFTPLSLLFTLLSSAILLCEIISLGRFYKNLL